jgi:molybdopterin molybdotransferase
MRAPRLAPAGDHVSMPAPLLSIAQARRLVADSVHALEVEDVPIELALGRVLAEDVSAAFDVPPFDNSAMDGFAVTAGQAGRRLPIVGESRAGKPAAGALQAESAMRISTGAAMPPGAEAVVPVEQAEERDGWVTPAVEAHAGENVRPRGDDVRLGEVVLRAGGLLGPAELGVAVAVGRRALRCGRRPRVAVLCTGDELREPGAALSPGQIHNSNAVTLSALAQVAGAEVVRAERIPDVPAATESALAQALTAGDAVVLSGGVSVGAHDHVKGALRALGVEQRFWGVALRPGKPAWFGVRERTLVFGLPGNPVSAMVTFLLFVRPALTALQGAHAPDARRAATLGERIPRNPGRDEAVRVRLVEYEDELMAVPTGPQGSHQLTSMLGADALLIVEAGDGEVPAGTRVSVELL